VAHGASPKVPKANWDHSHQQDGAADPTAAWDLRGAGSNLAGDFRQRAHGAEPSRPRVVRGDRDAAADDVVQRSVLREGQGFKPHGPHCTTEARVARDLEGNLAGPEARLAPEPPSRLEAGNPKGRCQASALGVLTLSHLAGREGARSAPARN